MKFAFVRLEDKLFILKVQMKSGDENLIACSLQPVRHTSPSMHNSPSSVISMSLFRPFLQVENMSLTAWL